MNKFPLEIDGKEYILTVNRRTNTLAKAPQEKLAKLVESGISPKALSQLSEAKNDEEIMSLLEKYQVPIQALVQMNQNNVEEYEEMFCQCILPEHPMERDEALLLLDKAEEEYGWDEITKALEVMSAQGFTMSAASKKKILWAETVKQGRKSRDIPKTK